MGQIWSRSMSRYETSATPRMGTGRAVRIVSQTATPRRPICKGSRLGPHLPNRYGLGLGLMALDRYRQSLDHYGQNCMKILFRPRTESLSSWSEPAKHVGRELQPPAAWAVELALRPKGFLRRWLPDGHQRLERFSVLDGSACEHRSCPDNRHALHTRAHSRT